MGKLFIILQYLLPHHLLSAVMHRVTRVEWTPFKNYLIRRVISLYNVDMSVAEDENPLNYRSFNAFFTRRIKADQRPIAGDGKIASPVDGTVSQAGYIDQGDIFQAKNHTYTLVELLGGNQHLANEFENGQFATIYLSPRDYHRIHMPCSGKLRQMIHVPGRLFSVNPLTTNEVPRLFARNERVISIFDSEDGPFAVIMVGAIFVSSMDTVWSGTITPLRNRPSTWQYQYSQSSATNTIQLDKGDEMGRFNMGSTVILLFPEQLTTWFEDFVPNASVKMGQPIGSLTKTIPAESEKA